MKEETAKPNENASVDSRKRISKVKVALTLGHSASHRSKTVTSGDYTHDWSFYVRGDPGCKIQNYIDRVVFKLHESFSNPVQVIKKPPYEIHEQGYGTFILLVEVNFKNKREPRQIEYKYDLVLPADGVPPIKRCRKEILTFTNPNTEFMTKLIDGGGTLQQGNLLPASVPKQPAQIEPPREPSVPSPSVNKNKGQPPKLSKEQEERRLAKEKRKEKKKEKRVIEEDDVEDEEEDIKVKKKEKKKERNLMEEEDKVEHKPIVQNEPEASQAVAKDSKKHHKKSSRPATSSAPLNNNKESTVEKKSKPDTDKQKQKISSVLAAIGDVESSDDEKYFKESPQREPVKHQQQTEPQSTKKIPPKAVQKDKPKRPKQEDAFLEFDSVDALKVKKKLKTKPEKLPGKVLPDSDRKPTIPIKEEKARSSKPIKVEKESKPSKKYSSSNSDEENKPAKKSDMDDTFLEFDSLSTLKSKKKSHEKPQPKSDYHEKPKKRQKEEVAKTKEYIQNKKKEKSRSSKEMKQEKPRKRSSSLSSDTEDDAEEDGEIRTPSSDVDIDADEAEVARILGMELEEKVPQKTKSKDKKNKHKAVKKDPELAFHPPDIKDETEEAPMPKIKSEGSSKFSASPMQPESSTLKQEKVSAECSTSRQSKSYLKPPEFHRAAPDPEPCKTERQSPLSSSHMPDIPSPRPRQRLSESSHDQEHVYRPDQAFSGEMVSSIRQEPSIMSPDHLRFMLNIYNKINQLQKTDDKSTISEVVNILSTHGNSNMIVKDENVTFDLVNCDLDTLHSIDSVLS